MENNNKRIALSNNLIAVVSLAAVAISGISIPVAQFDQAKPYVDSARANKPSVPTLEVAGYSATLSYPEPVINAGSYTFTLTDFDNVVKAIEELREEARKPKSKEVEILPGYVAVVTAEGITVNGQKINDGVLEALVAAKEEVNS